MKTFGSGQTSGLPLLITATTCATRQTLHTAIASTGTPHKVTLRVYGGIAHVEVATTLASRQLNVTGTTELVLNGTATIKVWADVASEVMILAEVDDQGSAAIGPQVNVIEQTISLVGNAALYQAVGAAIPVGAVITSVQANIDVLAVGGSTTVKVGIGPSGTPSKYGLTTVLTKNAKINTIPDWAVLSGAEQLAVCACATGGAAGDTALTAGSVRVKVTYLTITSLSDA